MKSKTDPYCILPLLLGLTLSVLVTAVWGQGSSSPKIPFKITPAPRPQSRPVNRGPAWHHVETRFTRIEYQQFDDLKRLNRSIDYSPKGLSLPGFLSRVDDQELPAVIRKKIDGLYRRVQEILDMRSKVKKTTIRIFSNTAELKKECHRLTGGSCRIRAWYIFENNTIYINAKDVHEGMLAHEMAHAIIDHYFAVRPPRATAEILARYVDKNLHF